MVRILSASALFCFCILTFSHNKADVDLWGNAGFVTALPGQMGFHHTNTYSFTEPDSKWTNHEWLAEYFINRAFVFVGNPGLIAGKILLGFLLIAIILSSIRKTCSTGVIIFLFMMVMLSTIGYGYSTRPHLFTYILIALYLKILTENRLKNLHLLALIGITAIIWANLHGAFFIGAIILLVFALFKDTTPTEPVGKGNRLVYSIAFILFVACSMINPYGTTLWSFVGNSAMLTRPYLSEWAPFNPLTDFQDHTDFMALTAISAFCLIFSKKRRSAPMLAVILLAFVSAVCMRRNIPLFAIAACFIIPEHAESALAQHIKGLRALNSPRLQAYFLAVMTAMSLSYSIFFNKANFFQMEVQQDRFPVDVFRFVKDNGIKGNAIVFFDWAEYAIWNVYPDCKVFMDGRFDSAYGNKSIKDYLDFIYHQDNWSKALSDYPTDMAILHIDNPAYKALLTTPGWSLVYESDIAGLILKNDSHKEFFDKIALKQIKQPVINKTEYFP